MASSTSNGECPLHSLVCQLLALKRRSWLSEVDKEVGPSIDIPLSSNKTINFPSPKLPAKEIAPD